MDYRKAKIVLQPYREKLQRAEDTLTEAQEVYVEMRQEMLMTKAALEETVDSHKQALKKSNAIESEVKVCEDNNVYTCACVMLKCFSSSLSNAFLKAFLYL